MKNEKQEEESKTCCFGVVTSARLYAALYLTVIDYLPIVMLAAHASTTVHYNSQASFDSTNFLSHLASLDI